MINNVITLASVPIILAKGAAYYRDFGMGRSLGTMPFQLAGNIRHGGLVERAFGLTLRELLDAFGGGTARGRPLRAVQVGGPLGAYLPDLAVRHPAGLRSLRRRRRHARPWRRGGLRRHARHGAHGALRPAVLRRRILRQVHALPHRLDPWRGSGTLDKIAAGGPGREQQVHLLRDLCDTMLYGSLCALGGMTPYPVACALKHFPAGLRHRVLAVRRPSRLKPRPPC